MKYLLPILCLFVFSCDSESPTSSIVHGCLDSQACNYNPNANIDNNSCIYFFDECGDCGGDNSSCSDECGIPNGDNSSCLDDCGIPNGNNLTCTDCNGVVNGNAYRNECDLCITNMNYSCDDLEIIEELLNCNGEECLINYSYYLSNDFNNYNLHITWLGDLINIPNFENRVVGIHIESPGILDQVPDFITQLDFLGYLHITNNNLTEIPSNLCDIDGITTEEAQSYPIRLLFTQF